MSSRLISLRGSLGAQGSEATFLLRLECAIRSLGVAHELPAHELLLHGVLFQPAIIQGVSGVHPTLKDVQSVWDLFKMRENLVNWTHNPDCSPCFWMRNKLSNVYSQRLEPPFILRSYLLHGLLTIQ